MRLSSLCCRPLGVEAGRPYVGEKKSGNDDKRDHVRSQT